jgi:hypothetical protein
MYKKLYILEIINYVAYLTPLNNYLVKEDFNV